MDKYETIDFLGEGSFAKVSKAKDLKTGEIVAIKKLKKKYSTWQECVDLREVKSLNKLKQNDNIIKLKEMIRTEENLYLVFEYMEKNLYELMTEKQSTKKFSEAQIKYILFQTLQGIAYMHKYGFFHRDLKPENLLVSGDKIKIADFGLAREIRSIPPYTDYVSTRYYRAPECILKSTNYNSPVDIWAVGCIMAELYNFKPMFYGASEKEVFFRIASVLGTPTSSTWPEGIQLAKKCDIKFPNCSGVQLAQLIPDASKDAIDLLAEMLRWDPNKRATATNLLQHSFFTKTPIPSNIGLGGRDNIMQVNTDFSTKNEVDKSVKTFSTNNNKNMNKDTKAMLIGRSGNSEISYINKKEEDDISKMLEDTVGFNKFIKKLKNEKMEEDLKFEMEQNKTNYFKEQISPIASQNKLEEEFDFEIDRYFGKEKLHLNKKEINSILNINITNLTNTNGPPTYSSVANNGYNYNQKFFDNSVINKLNQENTIITSNLNNYETENNEEVKKNEGIGQEKNFDNNFNKNIKESNPFNFGDEMDRDKIKTNYVSKNNFGSIESNAKSMRRMESNNQAGNNKESELDIRSNLPLKTEENIGNILTTDTNEITIKEFQSVRRRGKGSALKILNVQQEKNKINISPYIVKSESINTDADKPLNPIKNLNSSPKIENDNSASKKLVITKEKSNENIEKLKKRDTKEESIYQDLRKNQEDSDKKITLINVPEKNNDLDFENKNVYLKNVNPQNNRPNSRKRSAFKCLEELEKEINITPKNSNSDKVNYLNTVNSIINTDIQSKNNIPPLNNLNNFNKLINNSTQKPPRERKPEIKNPVTYNKITMPSIGASNNPHSNHYHTSLSNNKDVAIGNTYNKHLNSDNFNYNENLNKNYPPALSGNNTNMSNKKPEFETRRRKLINSNNNITGIDNDLNLNQTAANPTSNNLINFENQIKNAGMFNHTNSNNNILNRFGNISNMRNPNDDKGFLHTPINIKDNNDIYSYMNNTNGVNSNPMNLTKFSNVNSRIESRRVTTNAANNIINHSYFGTTDKNLTSTRDKDSNKNKNFLII